MKTILRNKPNQMIPLISERNMFKEEKRGKEKGKKKCGEECK
jgi:hypothetical protein